MVVHNWRYARTAWMEITRKRKTNNSFELDSGKSKKKAAVTLLKSFLIIHEHHHILIYYVELQKRENYHRNIFKWQLILINSLCGDSLANYTGLGCQRAKVSDMTKLHWPSASQPLCKARNSR